MAKYKLLLPKMGESVAEATVIRWTKNPGDYVEADETVMEIATDKVDSDVPSPVAGRLAEQLCKDNDVVQVGAVIAIIETAEPEVKQQPPASSPVTNSIPQPVAPIPQKAAEEVKQAAVSITAPLPNAQPSETENRPFSAISPTVTTGSIPASATTAEQPGIKPPVPTQPVFEQQNLANTPPVPYTEQLESSPSAPAGEANKGTIRFYSPLVRNIAAQEKISNAELDKIPGTGAEARLTKDDLLLYIQNRQKAAEASSEQASSPEQPNTAGQSPMPEEATIAEPATEPAAVQETDITSSIPNEAPLAEPVTVSPEPATLAEEKQPIAVEEKAPEDAPASPEMVAQTPPAAPQPVYEALKPAPEPLIPTSSKPAAAAGSMSGGDEIIEMDRMRRLIADHMVMSKHTSPHVTSFVEADVTNIVQWREKIKASFEKREGEKITFTPIFIEAVVRAIKDLPMINCSVNGTQIIKKKDINISMATALPSGNLIVPVIKRADELSLLGLTKSVNDLAARARGGKLKPDDVQGGTFTITNVGTFGNVMGTPIINQPQVAILAVGAIKKKPAVIETLQGDMIGIRHMMFLSLSYDHRVVDGALGGSFVRRVADYLENWDPGREI